MHFQKVQPDAIPMALLLEADPCEAMIDRYLSTAQCFVANVDNDDEDNAIVAVCIVQLLEQRSAEIVNMAVTPSEQGKGIGSRLLRFMLNQMKEAGISRIELGTGSFGPALAFYQRAGFRVESVVRDYFLTHYNEPIFEDGIQHKDQLRLTIDL